MQPISRYSKNNKQLFWMVPKWLTSYFANYVINQWSTAFGPISNPSVFEVPYLVKYFGCFKYFISHDIKNRFKNAVTLVVVISFCTRGTYYRTGDGGRPVPAWPVARQLAGCGYRLTTGTGMGTLKCTSGLPVQIQHCSTTASLTQNVSWRLLLFCFLFS